MLSSPCLRHTFLPAHKPLLPVRVQGPVASLRLSVCVWVLQQLQLFHDGGTIRFTQCVLSCGADAMAAAAAAGRPARRWRRWRRRQRQQQRAGLRGCGLLVCLCGLLFGSGVLLHSSHAAAPRSDRIQPAVRTRRRIVERLWRLKNLSVISQISEEIRQQCVSWFSNLDG